MLVYWIFVMNAFSLASLPVLAAAIISTQNPAPIVAATDEEIAPAQPAESVPVGPGLGPHRTLQTGKLDMGNGLQSGARGLTPSAEWRAMFPAKPGTP